VLANVNNKARRTPFQKYLSRRTSSAAFGFNRLKHVQDATAIRGESTLDGAQYVRATQCLIRTRYRS
jgi:hypothetical protein